MHPFGGEPVAAIALGDGAVATSGVDARLWGAAAHHLLDPATGEPAWTGVVSATALAPDGRGGRGAREGRAAAPGRSPAARCSRATAAACSCCDDGSQWSAAVRRHARAAAAARACRASARGGGMTGRDPMEYAWWLASRASGIVALALISLSVILGLAMAGRVSREPKLRRAMIAVHEHAALAALIAIAVHGITLLGDKWLDPGPLGILVPFHMDHEPLWTGLGIIGGYLAAALGLSFYARRRIGDQALAQPAQGDDPRLRAVGRCTRSARAATPARRGCARRSS